MNKEEKLSLMKYFPNSMPVSELFDKIDKAIGGFSYEKNLVKPATAMCRDDSITGMIKELHIRNYMAPFNMETLSGLPVFGISGYIAFYHHIPDNGLGLIIFSPHVGLSEKGVFGDLERSGVKEISKSCGANFAILGKWTNGKNSTFNDDEELSRVSSLIKHYSEDILNSDDPIVKIAEVEYFVGLKKFVQDLKNLQSKEKHYHPLLIVSGIHIDRKEENYFDLREIGLIENGNYIKKEL